MANMTFKANLLPNSDLGYSLGSSDKKWTVYGAFKGNADTATKATQDGSGNTITSKYVTIDTAQTITGTKSWGSSGAGGQLNGAATNGGINSLRIGDDVWLGDCNVGGIMGMKSTGSNCGFYMYNSNGTNIGQLYFNGTQLYCDKTVMIPARSGVSYINGANGTNAGLWVRKGTGSVWYPAVSLETSGGGAWQIGNYNDETLEFHYATKANRDSNTNTTSEIFMQNGDTGRILTSGNYTNWCPSKTGSGASGTWAISISGSSASCTGNAASATTASSCTGNSYGLLSNNTSQAADACYNANPGLHFWRYNGSSGQAGGDGWIMQWSWNQGSVGGQLYLDDNPTRTMMIRGCSKSSGTTGTEFNDWKRVWVEGNSVTGAVWNDYAEMRDVPEANNTSGVIDGERSVLQAGRCVREIGDGTMMLTTARMQKGCKIISDTFGFLIGETDNCKTPIAVSGRALAYLYEGREEAHKHIGDPVCSGPNGTISLMTDEEYATKGYCCVGIISEVPDYEIYGTGKVPVDGRIWIYVK